MKKIFTTFAVSVILSTTPAFSIDEDWIYLDPSQSEENSAPFTLKGYAKERQIYSYGNYAESIESTGANVDVITQKDIERQASPTLSEILNQSASLFVQNSNGSDGSVSTIRMRGTDRVRMTIDGIRADRPSLTTPGVEPQFLLSDDLERVEIIRGPHGNVAGTNASGGLIALQTKRGRGPFRVQLGSEMGNLGTFKERFAISGEAKNTDYYMGLTWYKTDGGMSVTNLGKIINDDYNNLSIVTNVGQRLLDQKAEVRNIFRFARSRKDLGVGYQQAFPYGLYQSPNNYALNYDIMNTTSFTHSPNEKYDYDFKFSLYRNNNNNYILPDNLSGDPFYESISKIYSTRLNAQTQHNYKLADWNTLSVGYNLEAEFIDGHTKDLSMWSPANFNSYDGHTVQNDVFINDVINIADKLFIRGGARLIHNSSFGTYVTPNASAALVLPTFNIDGAKTKLRASWGHSVNNPTLYQRFGTVNSSYMISLANPNLESEKMNSWDVGFVQSFYDEKLSFDVSYFNSDYKDYIGYAGSTDPITWLYTGQYINVDRAEIQGVEGKITWEPINWFKATASYTHTHSKDKTTGASLPGCPENSFKTILYWTPSDVVNFFAGLEANSGRYMTTDANSDKTDSYVDVKLGTKIRLFKNDYSEISLNGVIYNLLDQDISMYKQNGISYYAPGIHFRAGIGMEFTLPERKQKDDL